MSARKGLDVYLPLERTFGQAFNGVGAFYTLVSYTKNGVDYEVFVENDEFILLEDLIEYDDDDE